MTKNDLFTCPKSNGGAHLLGSPLISTMKRLRHCTECSNAFVSLLKDFCERIPVIFMCHSDLSQALISAGLGALLPLHFSNWWMVSPLIKTSDKSHEKFKMIGIL